MDDDKLMGSVYAVRFCSILSDLDLRLYPLVWPTDSSIVQQTDQASNEVTFSFWKNTISTMRH